MRTKWASISTAGRLTLDSTLLNLPRELGEFVIVHELVHLLVPNHGTVMKHFLFAYMPDWQQRERSLQCQRREIEVRERRATNRRRRGARTEHPASIA